MADKEPMVVNTGGSGGGWAVAIILAVLVIGGLLLFGSDLFDGVGSGGNTNVDVNAPNIEAPQAPPGGQEAQPAPSGGTQPAPAPSGAAEPAPSGGTQQ